MSSLIYVVFHDSGYHLHDFCHKFVLWILAWRYSTLEVTRVRFSEVSVNVHIVAHHQGECEVLLRPMHNKDAVA